MPIPCWWRRRASASRNNGGAGHRPGSAPRPFTEPLFEAGVDAGSRKRQTPPKRGWRISCSSCHFRRLLKCSLQPKRYTSSDRGEPGRFPVGNIGESQSPTYRTTYPSVLCLCSANSPRRSIDFVTIPARSRPIVGKMRQGEGAEGIDDPAKLSTLRWRSTGATPSLPGTPLCGGSDRRLWWCVVSGRKL
jgi:hypothetical protein